MRMISDDQNQRLFDFVKSKKVKYIEVQVELVDHLATGIEELVDLDPKLDFEEALKIVHGSFESNSTKVSAAYHPDLWGMYELTKPSAFKKIEREKQILLGKQLDKRIKEYLIKAVTPPMVVKTFLIWILLISLFSLLPSSMWLFLSCVIICSSFYIKCLVDNKKLLKRGANFLSLQMLLSTKFFIFFSLSINCSYLIIEFIKWLDISFKIHPLFATTLATSFIIICYIIFISFSNALRKKLEDEYAHYLITAK